MSKHPRKQLQANTSSTRTVLVPNLPTRFDSATGLYVPTVDLTGVEPRWGRLRIATEGRVHPGNIKSSIAAVRAAVEEMQPGDMVMMMGDSVVVAAALAAAWDLMGEFLVLRWKRELAEYAASEVPDLWAEPEDALEKTA